MASTTTETFSRCSSWHEAVRQSAGYEDHALVAGLASRLAEHPPWANPRRELSGSRELELALALAMVRSSGSGRGAPVRVADVGGGNGYLREVANYALGAYPIHWTVFETPAIAEAYDRLPHREGLQWRAVDGLSEDEHFDLAIFSCSLNYMPRPIEALQLWGSSARHVLIMRLPLVDGPDDVPTVQRIADGAYGDRGASWPSWFLSRAAFDAAVAPHFVELLRWRSADESWLFEGEQVRLQGRLFEPLPPEG